MDIIDQLDLLHLREGLDLLTEEERSAFLKALEEFGSLLLDRQREVLSAGALPVYLKPVEGEHALDVPPAKNAGCIVLAGGMGTRLGFNGPKGCFEILPGRTLFHILADKIKSASCAHVAIMTSPKNHDETVAFFEKHDFFGLEVDFFTQDLLPFCDDEGNWVLERPGRIACAPDGNGRTFDHFYGSPIYKKWKEQGIKAVNIVPVDNVLADPFDPVLLQPVLADECDLAVNGILKKDKNEKVGVLGLQDERLAVHEYTEVVAADEALSIGNTGLFACSLSFIEDVAAHPSDYLHVVRKEGIVMGVPRLLWKFETFIFDRFNQARRFKVFLRDREKIFAPLKQSGDIPRVRRALTP